MGEEGGEQATSLLGTRIRGYAENMKLKELFHQLLADISEQQPQALHQFIVRKCENKEWPPAGVSQNKTLPRSQTQIRRLKPPRPMSSLKIDPAVDAEKARLREEARKRKQEEIKRQRQDFLATQKKRNSQRNYLKNHDEMFVFVGRTSELLSQLPTFREQDFTLLNEIGKGNYGVVFSAIEKSSQEKVAIKILRNTGPKMEKRVKKEYDIQTSMTEHPAVVKAKGLFADDLNLYIVQELVEGGELFDAIQRRRRYDENTAGAIFKQLLSAISFMHQRGVGHFDLKPQNILCDAKDPNHVKITDFGVSTLVDSKSEMTAIVGTPQFCAPEILQRKFYGLEVDCWSLGCVLFLMLSGQEPFPFPDRIQLIDAVSNAQYNFSSSSWSDVSEQAKDLVTKLLTVEKSTRISASDALKHDWITKPRLAQPLATAITEMRSFNKESKRNRSKAVKLLKLTNNYFWQVMSQTIQRTGSHSEISPRLSPSPSPRELGGLSPRSSSSSSISSSPSSSIRSRMYRATSVNAPHSMSARLPHLRDIKSRAPSSARSGPIPAPGIKRSSVTPRSACSSPEAGRRRHRYMTSSSKRPSAKPPSK